MYKFENWTWCRCWLPFLGCHCWGLGGGWVYTLADWTCWLPLLGAIAGLPLLAAIAGCHCWGWGGDVAGCHCWAAIAGCHCWG